MERKYKLMLVDDEPWALTGIEEIIDWEAEGFTVVARCGCGRDGILAAQIHQPDAVVTDIRMPDMSGLEMIRQIREIPVPAECVIVSAIPILRWPGRPSGCLPSLPAKAAE